MLYENSLFLLKSYIDSIQPEKSLITKIQNVLRHHKQELTTQYHDNPYRDHPFHIGDSVIFPYNTDYLSLKGQMQIGYFCPIHCLHCESILNIFVETT